MREALRHSLTVMRNLRLVALHLVGNAVLMVCVALWLLIPEAHVWQLLFAAVSALLLVIVFLWIHAGTMVYAIAPASENFRSAFSIKIARLAWLLIGSFVLIACVYKVSDWAESRWQVAGYLYSKAPSLLRPTAGSSEYASALEGVLTVIVWYLLPCILFPFIVSSVTGGSSLRGLRALRCWQYWVGMAIAILVGVGVSGSLIEWKPGGTLTQQTVSLVIRILLAYLVATFAWLMTIGLVGHFVGPPGVTDVGLIAALRKQALAPGSDARSIGEYCLAVIRHWQLVVLQLVGCVVLVTASDAELGYRPWQIVAAVVVGLLLLIAFLWLHSGTLKFAADPAPGNFRIAFRFQFRRIGWMLLGLVVTLMAVAGLLALLSLLTSGGSSSGPSRATNVITLFLVPCLVLPWVMAKVGTEGRIRLGLNAIRSWQYWAGMAIIVFFAHLVSDWLPVWHFETRTVPRQILFSLGISISYFPYVIAWILIAGLLGYFVSSRERGDSSDVRRQTAS